VVFKTTAIDHSAISPLGQFSHTQPVSHPSQVAQSSPARFAHCARACRRPLSLPLYRGVHRWHPVAFV